MLEDKGSYYLGFPRKTVFAYMSKPENAAEVAPSLNNSRSVEKRENGGHVVEADYDLGGLIDGNIRLYPVVFQENNRIRYEMRDKFSGYVDWEFKEERDGTRFIYETQVDVDVPLPRFIVNRVSSMLAKQELDAIIENLRSELSEFEE